MSKIGQDVSKCTEDITESIALVITGLAVDMVDTGRIVDMDTGVGGIDMVFVKVRETYDLHTVQNKMTVIGIHTPKPDIIKLNFPGLLMQCKAYRPVSADVKIACASVLPLDPQGVGLAEGDVAPEDVFNPILYKACSNFGMSQIEARIWQVAQNENSSSSTDVIGQTAGVDVDSITSLTDEFPIYYGFLSNAHGWKHANPQSGLSMKNLKPLVYEMLYNVADGRPTSPNGTDNKVSYPAGDGTATAGTSIASIRGNAKPLPFINCTSYTGVGSGNSVAPGFNLSVGSANTPGNAEQDVPWINCVVGAIIVPPSRLHELFYRMVVEWTIEFSAIRPLSEVMNWSGLGAIGNMTHYQNYSYEATKEALTGTKETILESDSCMVSANVDVQKVM